jgi:hypothetical protein
MFPITRTSNHDESESAPKNAWHAPKISGPHRDFENVFAEPPTEAFPELDRPRSAGGDLLARIGLLGLVQLQTVFGPRVRWRHAWHRNFRFRQARKVESEHRLRRSDTRWTVSWSARTESRGYSRRKLLSRGHEHVCYVCCHSVCFL